jgi:hypothetical protein
MNGTKQLARRRATHGERQRDGFAPQPEHARVALHAVICGCTEISGADIAEGLGFPDHLVSVIDPSHSQGTAVETETEPCCATKTCAPVSFGTCAHDFEAVCAHGCVILFILARP